MGGTKPRRGARLTIKADQGEFVTVLYLASALPAVTPIAGGVRVGDDEITFSGNDAGPQADIIPVRVSEKGRVLLTLAANEIDLNRSQGDIGLFVPDAGYPFGEIPDWLLRQRAGRQALPR